MPGEFQPLADAIYRDRVRRARLTPPEERLREGPRLFSGVCDRMKIGIRLRFPAFDEQQVQAQLRRQLARLNRLHEATSAAAEL